MMITILIKAQSLFVYPDGSMPLSGVNNEVFSNSVAGATLGCDHGANIHNHVIASCLLFKMFLCMKIRTVFTLRVRLRVTGVSTYIPMVQLTLQEEQGSGITSLTSDRY